MYQLTVPWWIFLITPLPNPNIMVKSANQKMILASTLIKNRNTGIQKLAPEMPDDIEMAAMIIPIGKRYQYVKSISVK
ncbi:MAG: hypothetical protein CVV36_09065 [Candidatus Methanoperedenaceae archaeon HGW-Methanoperedenaceae-1]|nr:MAG: hypothetical protein CVV36_09065 [Candidatus Methanoperedenaceae archaeon HGW-Methanoperedenaceae-1]